MFRQNSRGNIDANGKKMKEHSNANFLIMYILNWGLFQGVTLPLPFDAPAERCDSELSKMELKWIDGWMDVS